MQWANTSAQEEEARAKTLVEYLSREKEAGEAEIRALRQELKTAKDNSAALENALKEAKDLNLTETLQLKLAKKRQKLKEMKETNSRIAQDLQSEREKAKFLEEGNAALTQSLQLKEVQIAELLANRSLQLEVCKSDLNSTETFKPEPNAAESQWQTEKDALLQEVATLQAANAQLRGDSEKNRDTIRDLALTAQELNDKKQAISALEDQITALRSQLQSLERQPEACLTCQLS